LSKRAPNVHRIVVINGPNLDRLGRREPEVYGTSSLEDLEMGIRQAFEEVEFAFVQSNYEGVIVEAIHAAEAAGAAGVVLNPAGYGHTSVAIRDAITAVDVPVVEVHLSNVYGREDFRQTMMTAGVCAGVISGMGPAGYHLAVIYLLDRARVG
jgi:3-dehydroquinate dehydratase-2